MIRKKRILLVLFGCFICSFAFHILFGEPMTVEPLNISASWLIGMGFFVSTVVYSMTIRCPNPTCRRLQVHRGWSLLQIRWPDKRCYFCGVDLDVNYKNGRPLD